VNPARGRPTATRGVFAIEDSALVLPSRVSLDTSLVVHALIETESLHPACSGFIDRLVESEVTLVTSELLEVELAEATFGIALKERWGGDWRRHRRDGRARRRAKSLLADVLSRWALILDSAEHTAVPVGAVGRNAALLMMDFGLASYDAVHAASAIAAGAEAIATTDAGFAVLPTSLLLFVDRSRVASCRSNRPRGRG
jgi:predicted nucleic acid-binding protein